MVLSLALIYCFVADRTHVFNKGQKHFSSQVFHSLWTMSCIIGLLTIRRSKTSQKTRSLIPLENQNLFEAFLSRDQTDEWKGWMQCIILIYHYTGASKILWIYKIVRVLVASYLFMTGYGHTLFFYRTGDYSFKRFISTMIRLNTLSLLLPYIMGTNYLFYYFAPLVSFWFVVIFLTMRIQHTSNDRLSHLLSKIFCSSIIVTFLIKIPGILETASDLLSYACRIQWDIREWRFRVSLDLYIVYAGMLLGAWSARSSAFEGKELLPSVPNRCKRERPSPLRMIMLVLAIVLLPAYFVGFNYIDFNKIAYNKWHPYSSFIPVISFVVLRNSSYQFRTHHSAAFAWLGRCSLETFTLQYHIWLAGDTKGLLRLGVFDHPYGGGLEDFLMLTTVFLWFSWNVAWATGILTTWMVETNLVGSTVLVAEKVENLNGTGTQDQARSTNGEPGKLHQLGILLRTTMSREKGLCSQRSDLRLRVGLGILLIWIANLVSRSSSTTTLN